jgi:hypothetical protein
MGMVVRQASRGGGVVIVLRLSALTALAFVAYAQPKDVDGWDKIHWGMTIMQARSAYGVDTQPETKDDWTLLQLRPVKFGDIRMGAQVGARLGSQKIVSVRLWSFFGVPDAAPGAGPGDFDALQSMLTKDYGPPASEETRHGENFRLLKSVRWKFPSTTIALSTEQSTSIPDIGTIYLEFTAATK